MREMKFTIVIITTFACKCQVVGRVRSFIIFPGKFYYIIFSFDKITLVLVTAT